MITQLLHVCTDVPAIFMQQFCFFDTVNVQCKIAKSIHKVIFCLGRQVMICIMRIIVWSISVKHANSFHFV